MKSNAGDAAAVMEIVAYNQKAYTTDLLGAVMHIYFII